MLHRLPLFEPGAPSAPRRAGTRACALALLALVGAGAASSPATAASPKTNASAADRTFLQSASQGNRFEIASGDVAVQTTRKVDSAPAKKLAIMAGMIVSDHMKSQQRLQALAKRLDVNVSNRPDPVQQFLVSQLATYVAAVTASKAGNSTTTNPNETTTGDMGSTGSKTATTPGAGTTATTVGALRSFYLKAQSAVHQESIQMYSTIAINTKNQLVRAYACQSLPVLRQHLARVQQALGSAQIGLAMSGSKALSAQADAACKAPSA
jgi:hypothetical protein